MEESLRHHGSWLYSHRIPGFLKGKAVGVNAARAMFKALGQDQRVSFLEQIGSQRLVGDRKEKYRKVPANVPNVPQNIPHDEFMRIMARS